ncbi:ATP-binding sensor histidine kinase [Sorangium sp. So ce134]
MLNLKDYEIHHDIYRSRQTRVSRGRRVTDGSPVVLKYPAMEYPSLQDVARLKNEYDILKDLAENKVDHVVRAYALERLAHRTLMVYEDFGGIALKEHWAGKGVGHEEFLRVAIVIAGALAAVHRQNIIHKDISPSNILINPHTGEVKLIDFGIATRLSREVQELRRPDGLDGTLAYMSPEQTGRINRALDYRTDMYSLGATLYELLSGAPPFSSADAIELLHCHIASEPRPLVEHGIPQALSDIITKLMAKTPEERYQSALGLKADLEECLHQLRARGTVSAFKLGRQDISHRFEISQKLYGREREIAMLLDAFSLVCEGRAALLLVSGYSGIGKSSLIHEVQGPIINRRGYLAFGKFEQYNRDVPYSAMAKALNGLIHELLKEPASQVAIWKEGVRKAVGQNGQVMIEVIPALELLLGPQPAVPSLPPAEAQSRFNFVFEDLLGVLATEQHPLVLFLDDLQWADTPSLRLLELLVTGPRSKHLLVIAAYRDNEVDASHASMITISEIRKAGRRIHEIHLEPLALGSIMDLLADTLHCDRDATSPLAELLLRKTGGNPFFLVQLVGSLHKDGLLKFNPVTGAWTWDMAKLDGIGVTDNVIDLMTAKLRCLSDATREILKLAACIGNAFDLSMLSIVHEKTERETAVGIWPAVREGLVIPLSESYKVFQGDHAEAEPAGSAVAVRELISDMMATNGRGEQARLRYRFLHDRVQQATYALIPEPQRKVEHAKIGRLLLASTSEEHLDRDIFDIVAHLNVGRDLVASAAERLKLAELNYKAGMKARAATALSAANRHFSIALQLLPEDRWSAHYQLTLDLHRNHAECEFLLGAFSRADEMLTEAMAHARTRMDKGIVYETKMTLYLTQGPYETKIKAVTAGLEALRLLGCELPGTPEARAAKTVEESQEIATKLKARTVREIEGLPRLTDPEKLLVMNLSITLFAAAYLVGDFDIVTLCIHLVVRTSLDHGNSDASAFGYMMYGMLLSAKGEYRQAYEFGQLALALHERYPNPAMKPKIHNIFAHSINPYINHLDTNIPHYRTTYECCLEGGDLVYGLWAVFYMFWAKLMKGDALEEAYADSESCMDFVERAGDSNMLISVQCLRQVMQCLRGLTAGAASLDSDGFNESDAVQRLRDAQCLIGVCWHAMLRQIVDLTFERYDEAVRAVEVAEETLGAFIGFFSSMTHYFYSSLALLAVYAGVSTEHKKQYLALVERNSARIKLVADSCPENYLHCYQLIEAEKARVLGESTKAAELYDLSISNAQKGRFLNHEALALELAAKFYFSMGRKRVAHVYLSDAYHAYARWGAFAKVDQLKEKYRELLDTDIAASRKPQGIELPAVDASAISGNLHGLDIAIVMKASQAVSEEIVLSKLLEKLMRIVLQHAGAQRGYLILEQDGDLLIEASATMDGGDVIILQSVPVARTEELSREIVQYVQRTRKHVVLANAAKQGMFTSDSYVARRQPRSVLCMPMTNQGKLVGILYLENNLTEGTFTPSRMEVLRLLSAQVAISIENSRLYGHLEDKVKERTAELREAQAQLIRIERESTERRMAAGFAHEVRNALAGARLVLEKVLGGEADGAGVGIVAAAMRELGTIYDALATRLTDEELEPILHSIQQIVDSQRSVEKALRVAIEASSRALGITNRILNYSLIMEERKTSSGMVNLSELIASSIAALEEEMKGHGITITAAMAKSSNILGDSVPCYSIVQNLLNNARDAILEKGATGELGAIHVETGIVDQRFLLRVRDNGIGIKQENLDKVFDAFYSTKPNTGTGLGLATVKKIVDVNGGSIRVESGWRKGTTFSVLLPIAGILAWDEKRDHARAGRDQASV